ncbi:XRE family transcriptional regulator [Vibrio sinensis]|uniref:XRE family transcriptional regulator n=1 Tax=Vibrio sinensis TaxID=2302434 RepID=A0A3A6QUV2_9VIBR|nr:sugar diacid recognition domain-containing protein [Vibrio sinensis]RJX75138.1 XRE family transcriptional regulator [Vibrio sinensis]
MRLNEHIATQIVSRVVKIIPYSINVMDELGFIIGSSDPSRLNKRHEGSIIAITENRIVTISPETSINLKGVKSGINLPILYKEKVIGAVGVSGIPEDVKPYGELVKMTAELIVEQVSLLSKIQWHKRHKEELVMKIIKENEFDEEQFNIVAESLDIDLSKPRVVSIIKVVPIGSYRVSLNDMQTIANFLEFPERGNLVGGISAYSNKIIVLKPIDIINSEWSVINEQKRVNDFLNQTKHIKNVKILISVGDYFPNLDGISKSYKTAKLTLDFMSDIKSGSSFYQNNKLPILLSECLDDSWKAQQINKPLDTLRASDSKKVLEKTLVEFFNQNCDICQTAKKMGIHRNTLRYRLDKIEDITSLKISNINELITLYIPLILSSR